MNRLARLAARRERLVVGLMSGTSADGIDAALVRIRGSGPGARVEVLAAATTPFPARVRDAIQGLARAGAADIARWNMRLGEMFADAALDAIRRAGLQTRRVHLVGSHGQTIAHVPRARGRGAATLQIGEPSVIAERTGLPVVADFRVRDAAAGGEGAPLVPWADWVLLRPRRGARLAQNLGGVGNVTVVTPRADDVFAFDTGPGNAPIDAAAFLATGGRRRFDEGGALAARGRADDREVRRLLAHPWFRRPPPKSLDRDAFGAPVVEEIARRRPELLGEDLVATAAEFTARSVALAVDAVRARGVRPDEMLVSGGGVRNRHLMARLADLLAPLPVRSSAEAGVDPDSKEAVAFALLANETVCGRPGNLPRVTGATRNVVLGKLVF